MRGGLWVWGAILAFGLVACTPVDPNARLHETFDVAGPYPNPDAVCVAIRPDDATRRLTQATTGLIACPSIEEGAIADRHAEGFKTVGWHDLWQVLHKEGALPTAPKRAGSPLYRGKTFVFYDASHGTQVAYFAPGGVEWLWYPGNRAALRGEWDLRAQNGVPSICFRYSTESYNPVTRVQGGNWECTPVATHQTRIVESVKGDVFGLSSGAIPFVMQKRRAYSLAQLRR